MKKAIQSLYDSLADYLTFEELVFVDTMIVVGTAATVFYTGKYVIDSLIYFV